MVLDDRSYGFPPIVGTKPSLLVLGTLPGVKSIEAQAYYAHPRNQFWPIMANIVGFEATAAYAKRVQALQRAGIAVWDVLQSAERRGSLDSAIRAPVPSDIKGLLTQHPTINTIVFNGGSAETLFHRHIMRRKVMTDAPWQTVRAPSTSPAYTIPFADKLARWQKLIKSAL